MATSDTTIPEGDERDGRDILDDLDLANTNALSYSHMLYDLICQPGGDDPNDPAGRTQRMYACIAPLQARLRDMEAAHEQLRDKVAA